MGTGLGTSGRVTVTNKQTILFYFLQRFCNSIIFVFIAAIFFVPENVQAENSNDEIFGGQILSLTEKKPELKPSNDPRFKDNNDGTVTDLQEGLMWKKIDLYQEKKIWSSWEESQKLLEKFNKEAYASYSDWRLPTRKELKSLYEEDKNIPWKYYWTENMIHIDPIFGYSHCCFWSSELYKDKYAWGFNYIGGRDYPSMKGGGQYHLSLSTIRPVRTVSKKD